MNFIAELKRRNVIRMAGLYLVGAWLITQVAGTVLPMFDAPAWLPKSVVVLLAIGFIPALMFSWVFEMTPDGLKRDADIAPERSIAPQTARRMDRMIIAVLVLALGFFAFDRLVLDPQRDAALVATTIDNVQANASSKAIAAAAPAVDRNSIAVLPFLNMSGDVDNAYFSDGISEELLNVLAKVEGLGVASRTSSFAYKGSKLGSAAIAGELKVAHILEGSVRKSGNQVRITAQLIDAANDRHLWSETFDRELTDIFAIQEEIATAIVTALRVRLDGTDTPTNVSVRADTANMQAYDLYLKARELFIARKDLPESARLFERTVEMDPTFARGWEGLAAVGSVMPSWGFTDRDYYGISKRAAERALQLDPALSMPWAAMANASQSEWPVDYEKLLGRFDKAVAADGRNASALLWRGIAWTRLGFFDRAIADLDHCLRLEPGYHNCRSHRALALLLSGDEEAAIAELDQGIANGSFESRSESFIAPLMHRGNHTAALLLMDSNDFPPALRRIVFDALRNSGGAKPDAKAVIAEHLSAPDNPTVRKVGVTHFYLWLRDYEGVADFDDSATAPLTHWDRYPASFRNSPGMKRKMRNMGIPAYWHAHGFPPQCRPVGKDDFTCD